MYEANYNTVTFLLQLLDLIVWVYIKTVQIQDCIIITGKCHSEYC